MKVSALPWTVLFGGAGRENIIESLISFGVSVSKIVVPDKRGDELIESINVLQDFSVPYERTTARGLAKSLWGLEENVLLSIGFPYQIPTAIFSRHPIALNIHPTLLPKYRGPTTGANILINGEKQTGSSVHLIEENFDSGAIIAQSQVTLSPFDTIRSMQRRVYESEPDLLIEAIKKLESGYCPIEQDHMKASTFSRARKPVDSLIDSSRPLVDLVNEIRACDAEKFPAFFEYYGQKVCIKLWRPDKPDNEDDFI